MFDNERLLNEREKDQIFNIYVNNCNEYPQKHIFEMLIVAQDEKTVTVRDREWFKWAEEMALKVKTETLKEVGGWLQERCNSMSKPSEDKYRRSKYSIKINHTELEALKQGKLLKKHKHD